MSSGARARLRRLERQSNPISPTYEGLSAPGRRPCGRQAMDMFSRSSQMPSIRTGSNDVFKRPETYVNAGPAEAKQALDKAIDMFRGSPLAGLEDDAFSLRVEASRLEELRLSATEERLDAMLAIGENSDVSLVAERLVAEHPLRERLWGLLMTALYRSGRQAEGTPSFL